MFLGRPLEIQNCLFTIAYSHPKSAIIENAAGVIPLVMDDQEIARLLVPNPRSTISEDGNDFEPTLFAEVLHIFYPSFDRHLLLTYILLSFPFFFLFLFYRHF